MKIFGTTISYTLLVTVLNMLGGWLTARTLGPLNRGELSAILLWPNLLYSLASFGMFESLVYYIGRDRLARRSIASTGAAMLMCLSLVVTVAAFFVVPHILSSYDASTRSLAAIYCLTIPIATATMLGSVFLMATLQISWLNRCRSIGAALSVAGTLGVIATRHASVLAFVIVSFVTSLPALYLTFKPFLAGLRNVHVSLLSKPHAKSLLSFGSRSYVALLCNVANTRLDQALMAAFLAPSYLGWYVVSVSIAALTALVPGTINTVLFPLTVHSTREETRTALPVYLMLSTIISGSIAAASALLCPIVLPLLYGGTFRNAVLPAQILAIGSVAQSIGVMLGYYCRAIGIPGKAAVSEIIGLVATFALLPPFLWRLQITGAALASLVSYLATAVYLFVVVRRQLEMSVTQMFVVSRRENLSRLATVRAVLQRADRSVHGK